MSLNEEYKLSEAYDVLPVNIILLSDLDKMSLILNVKNKNLKRNDFLKQSIENMILALKK